MPAVKVFMSYRRVDNPFLAGRLKDELGRVFGDENVFYDVDSIRARAPTSVTVIRETLETVDAVIALVGSDWDAARLAASNDPVRTELREALEKKKLLIPVLVGDTVMPTPEQLPADLRDVRVPERSAGAARSRLRERCAATSSEEISVVSPAANARRGRRRGAPRRS